MHIDRTRAPDHVEDDRAPQGPSEPRTPGSQHDLRDPLDPRQVQDRVRNARPDHFLEAAADLPDELPNGLEVGGVIPACARDDVHGDQLAAAPRGHPRGAADHRLVLGTTLYGDEDPLARPRRLGSPSRRGPRSQLVVDPVGHPHERKLPQPREVLFTERLRQGGVHPLGREHVPVCQPALERLRGHVYELQLIRVPHERVGDRVGRRLARDPLDHVVQRLEVMDVDRRDHVDPGGEELLDVLPTMRVARPGGVRMSELVDHRDLRAASQDGVDVHLLGRCAIGIAPARRDLQTAGLRRHLLPAMRVDGGEHHVRPASTPAAGLVEHRERLAHARRVPDVDPQPSALHAFGG